MSRNTITLAVQRRKESIPDTLRCPASSGICAMRWTLETFVCCLRDTFHAARCDERSTMNPLQSWSEFPWIEYRDAAHQWDYFRMQH